MKNYGHRFVLDIYLKGKLRKIKEKSKSNSTKKSYYVIAIDAGHGGKKILELLGKGTKEKDIVLSIAKKLNKLLKKEKYKIYTNKK